MPSFQGAMLPLSSAAWASDMLVTYCNTSWYHNLEDCDLNLHCHEDLKFWKFVQ